MLNGLLLILYVNDLELSDFMKPAGLLFLPMTHITWKSLYKLNFFGDRILMWYKSSLTLVSTVLKINSMIIV